MTEESKKDVKEMAKKIVESKNVPIKERAASEELVEKIMSHACYDNPDYKWSLDDFELGTRLGRGQFGRVFIAREKTTGLIVALKTMSKLEVHNARMQDQTLKEIEIHSKLSHPNILQFLTWFHDDYRIYIVLEYAAKGELYKHLQESPNERFSENLAAKYIYQVADATNYCHSHNIMHRDIKPENLLLDKNRNLKLADFGLAIEAAKPGSRDRCGTPMYMSPEVVCQNFYGPLTDNWSLGTLSYEFLVGRPPFEDDITSKMYAKIKTCKCEFPDFMPEGGVDLIQKLLVRTPKKRLSLEGVMIHPWIQANYKPNDAGASIVKSKNSQSPPVAN